MTSLTGRLTGRLTGPQRAFFAGTVWVTGGTLLLGISAYAFLTLAGKRVPASEYAALSSLYLLVALVGPGLYMPVEQETTRLVSRARALELGTRDLVRQLRQLSAIVLGLALLVLVALGPFLVTRVFHGHLGLWFALVASVVGYAGLGVIRGVLAGQGHLRWYGAVVGMDGLARLGPCLIFAVAGVTGALPYGLALGAGPVAALLLALPATERGAPGARVAWSELVPATGSLVAASALALSVANIAPVIVNAELPNDPGRAGVFAFVFVLARLPLFLLNGVQPLLLPALSRSSARRDLGALRRDVRRALVVVAGIGVLALLLTAPICLWLSGALFPGRSPVSGLTITLLTVGTILAMLVQVVQPALIAVAGHRLVAGAWLLGIVCFGATFFLRVDPVTAATAAQIVAGAVTLAAMGFALRRHLRQAAADGPPPDDLPEVVA